jgi:predicted ATP-grasp superfamily ATP-dependent carboligase
MRILITGARAPVALELARALGGAGHTVYAADSIGGALAGRSRYVAGAPLLPPPRYRPAAFGEALLQVVERLGIELIIPTCEEVFYVGMAHAELSSRAHLFCEPLAELAGWHHKGAFQRRAASLGLATPRTALLRDEGELRAALRYFPRYLLKPAYSRFATRVITNCGPLAGRRPLAACRPSEAEPWLIQEYVDGEALCSYSLLHAGHITAHCAYVTPHTLRGGSGAAFLSVEGGPTLAVVRALGAGGYTGQLSLDFIQAGDGRLYLLECNPRATSAAHLMAPERLVAGLLDPARPTWVAPAGVRRQLALVAMPLAIGRALRRPWDRRGWRALTAGALAPDVIARFDDPLPALMQLPLTLRFLALGRRRGIGPLAATTDDIEWNGDADLYSRDP